MGSSHLTVYPLSGVREVSTPPTGENLPFIFLERLRALREKSAAQIFRPSALFDVVG